RLHHWGHPAQYTDCRVDCRSGGEWRDVFPVACTEPGKHQCGWDRVRGSSVACSSGGTNGFGCAGDCWRRYGLAAVCCRHSGCACCSGSDFDLCPTVECGKAGRSTASCCVCVILRWEMLGLCTGRTSLQTRRGRVSACPKP